MRRTAVYTDADLHDGSLDFGWRRLRVVPEELRRDTGHKRRRLRGRTMCTTAAACWLRRRANLTTGALLPTLS